ncbi:MAG: 2,3-bisphosphoglycerate-independent phosphoglycerate mutase, partial [Oscillospiraceae bacterium]
MKKPVVLCIMDGFGYNPSEYGNAILAANTPRLDEMMENNPMTYIGASGMDVGLPDGQMGNSEVGHTNIGAGRVVYQELTRISKSIIDGDFFENKAFL